MAAQPLPRVRRPILLAPATKGRAAHSSFRNLLVFQEPAGNPRRCWWGRESTHGRASSGCGPEMGRIVWLLTGHAVVTALDHTIGVVPLMITAVGRPLARHTTVDKEPRKTPPKARPPSEPTPTRATHLQKVRHAQLCSEPSTTRRTFVTRAPPRQNLTLLTEQLCSGVWVVTSRVVRLGPSAVRGCLRGRPRVR